VRRDVPAARRPRITTLWRAAAPDSPYFGRGSHWTTSEDAARSFQRWLKVNYSVHRVIYRAEVQLTQVYEPPSWIHLDASDVLCVALAWPEGYRWLAFHGAGEWDTQSAEQYVYLGPEPVRAVPGRP